MGLWGGGLVMVMVLVLRVDEREGGRVVVMD